MKRFAIWATLGVAAAVAVALIAGKGDIRKFRHMRGM